MGKGCHAGVGRVPQEAAGRIVLVGSPNVGKSALFNALTGARVTVSNYPGTTVEVYRGRACLHGRHYEVVDTPGMYSLLPVTEEEYVTRRLLMRERPDLVLHVVDAKNLERSLPLTLQLREAGLRLILVLNIIDEARAAGMAIDTVRLAGELGVPVVATAGLTGEGLAELREAVNRHGGCCNATTPRYEDRIDRAAEEIASTLLGRYGLSRRAVALLLLQGDAEIEGQVAATEGGNAPPLRLASDRRAELGCDLTVRIAERRAAEARRLAGLAVNTQAPCGGGWRERLGAAMIHPLWGLPILAIVLYVGLYQFVGVFGAGTVVGWLEEGLFSRYFNPLVDTLLVHLPYLALRDLIGGEYGLLTLGLRYAVALILPIVGTFFLAFAVLEDSGYLPRLAYLLDRSFKRLGLSGRAVIPLVLGFGCDTMATMVSRTLETRRERVIATFLLALAIPCSAQLGVILGILAGRPAALGVWAAVLSLVFLLAGALAKRLLPGEEAGFYLEFPPLRWPRWRNVLIKSVSRMQWYFFEIVPLFALASVLIWLGRLTGIFEALLGLLRPIVAALGLPPETARAFLFGFFRRDYGAGGLYDLARTGSLDGGQLVVAAVTMTLFVPCVAQFAVMVKERGWKTALGMAGFIFPFSFLVGFLLHRALTLLGVIL